MPSFTPDEANKLQSFLQGKFGQPSITVRTRPQAKDSLEVSLKGEFIGVIYKDDEDGDVSYTFTMAILDIDLEEVA